MTLFLAEMGDRTQFAALALAASTHKPWSVFFGALSGLALTLLVTVLLAEGLSRFFPEVLLRKASAILCIGVGVWMWWR